MPWQSLFVTGGSMVAGAGASAVTGSLMSPLQRASTYGFNALWPNTLPDPAAIIGAFRAGELTRPQATNLLKTQGITAPWDLQPGQLPQLGDYAVHADAWQGVWKSSLAVPAPGELLTLLNRGAIDNDLFSRWLQRNGMYEPRARAAFESLRYQLPGPSDLVMFALREAWDPQVVQRFGYDLEYPAELTYWMAQNGFAGDARTPAQIAAGVPPVSWPQFFWRVHWQPLAAGQLYEMFQRLRPGRIARLGPEFANVRPFTLNDVRTGLKVLDYPVPFRDQLTAIAFRQPRLIDLTKMVDLGVVDLPELIELHRDLGYDPTTAAVRASFVWRDRARQRTKTLRGNARAGLMEAYRIGAITRRQTAIQLYILTFAGLPLGEQFAQLPPAFQATTAESEPAIVAALADEDRKVEVAHIKQVLATVQKRFLTGLYSPADVTATLRAAGMADVRIGQYLARWQVQLAGPRMFASTAQIVRWLKQGLIPLDVARQYLSNLGWAPGQLVFVLAEAQRGYALAVRQEQERQARTERQRQTAIRQQLAEIEKQRRQALQRLTAQATAAQLQNWFVLRIIDEARLRAELARRNFDADAVAARVQEALIKRSERDQRRAAARGSSNGNGATGGTNGTAPS